MFWRQVSPGVDGVKWKAYETGWEDRLVDLHNWVHRDCDQGPQYRWRLTAYNRKRD